MNRTLYNEARFRNAIPPQAATALVTSTWFDMTGVDEIVFAVHGGDIGANVTVDAVMSGTNDGTGTTQISFNGTYVGGTHVNGTDENLPGILTVRNSYLTGSNKYVAVNVIPASGTQQIEVLAILRGLHEEPATNTVNTHVAFAVGHTGH